MADKRRYTVTLPDHVADAIEVRAKTLTSTPTEYAADVMRWWFGQGCPAVTSDEAALRRIKPQFEEFSVWSLQPEDMCRITDDSIVLKLLAQLEIPNLFAQALEHDEVRMCVVFDNHPTHWLQFDLFKGTHRPGGDGLMFQAFPKTSVTRTEMLRRLKEAAAEMGASEHVDFSQIPMLEKKKSGNQTTPKTHAS